MKRDTLIFLFIIGFILFNWPFLLIFDQHLPSFLFFTWLAFIALVYFASTRSEREDGGN